jgi:isochorismate synthase
MIKTQVHSEIASENLLQLCIEANLPFAIYKYPDSANANFLVSFDKDPVYKTINFEELGAGFVMAPFETKNELPYFITADYISSISQNGNLIISDALADLLHLKKINNISHSKKFRIEKNTSTEEQEKSKHILIVSEAIKAIEEGLCKKVVLSRKKKIGTITEDNYFLIFQKLCEIYPTAFISLVYLPWKNQIWMGASPETLVHQNSEGYFETVALAGTQNVYDKNGVEITPKEALWSQKEIEEQALVGRYIINCLKKIRVREYLEEGPKTIKAGNLLHLNSTFRINTKDIFFENLSSTMLDLLHPTSAVGGMPKEEALTLLKKLEDYPREFYSGYLGAINVADKSHLYVNIRSMKIENKQIFAYAGGGITENSDPEKEWIETALKLKTIENVFENL